MPIAYVRSESGQDYGGSFSTTIETGSTLALTAGNTNIVAIRHGDATGSNLVTGVTDTAGNTYVPYTGGSYRISNAERLTVYYALNVTGHASNIVTATFSTSVQYRGIVTNEYSGLALTSVEDAVATGGTSSATLVSSSFSTVQNDELIFVVSTIANVLTTWTPDTGYTLRGEDGFRVTSTNDQIVSSTLTGATVTVTNSDGSSPKAILVVTFKAPGGGGGGASPWYYYAQQ